MGSEAKIAENGFVCPIKNCNKRKNSLYTLGGVLMHLQVKHPGLIEKRLKLKYGHRTDGKILKDK